MADLDGLDVRLETCDITSSDWPALVSSVAADRGRLDVLVNNAHVGRGGSLRQADPAAYAEAFALAVTATSAAINAARPGLAASAAAGGPASVVNVASMYGVVAPDPGSTTPRRAATRRRTALPRRRCSS